MWIAPLIAALAFTTACEENESDPMTHVARLNDPAKQTKATETLMKMAGNALSDEKGDHNGKTFKALLDKIVDPLTKLCTDGKPSDAARANMIKTLADSWDPRSAPCLNKVLGEWTQGTNDTEALLIFRSVASSKMPEMRDSVMKVFTTLKCADAHLDNLYIAVQDAAAAVATPADVPKLEDLLKRPWPGVFMSMKTGDATEQTWVANGKKVDPKTIENEAFWQAGAALMLGKLGADSSIKPLVKILLDPAKIANNDVNTAAHLSLVKFGTKVIKVAEPLIKGTDTELVQYSKEESMKPLADIKDAKALKEATSGAEKAYVGVAAEVLSNVRTKEAVAPILAALDGADDYTKAVLVSTLAGLPKTDESVKAFKSTFDAIKPDTSSPAGGRAREWLIKQTTQFYDASFVPWIIDEAGKVKDNADDFRDAALEPAITLMTSDQTGDVWKLYTTKDSDGKPIGKFGNEDTWYFAKAVVDECTDKVECYFDKVMNPKYWDAPKRDEAWNDPKNKDASHEKWDLDHKENLVAGLKAITMIGVLAKPDTKIKDVPIKQALIDAFPKITFGAFKTKLLELVLLLSPDGDKELAAKLQADIDAADAAKDEKKIKSLQSFKQLVTVLNMRAGVK